MSYSRHRKRKQAEADAGAKTAAAAGGAEQKGGAADKAGATVGSETGPKKTKTQEEFERIQEQKVGPVICPISVFPSALPPHSHPNEIHPHVSLIRPPPTPSPRPAQLVKLAQDRAQKSHRAAIEEFNSKLSALSEHHDIPRVGPG